MLILGLALGFRLQVAWANLETIFKDLGVCLSRSVTLCITLERCYGFIILGALLAVLGIVVERIRPRWGLSVMLAFTVLGLLYQSMIVVLMVTPLDGLSQLM